MSSPHTVMVQLVDYTDQADPEVGMVVDGLPGGKVKLLMDVRSIGSFLTGLPVLVTSVTSEGKEKG